MESLFVVAAVLACPIGMGLMMLFMGKGMLGSKRAGTTPPGETPTLAALKSEQARLHEQIERLQDSGRRERTPVARP